MEPLDVKAYLKEQRLLGLKGDLMTSNSSEILCYLIAFYLLPSLLPTDFVICNRHVGLLNLHAIRFEWRYMRNAVTHRIKSHLLRVFADFAIENEKMKCWFENLC